MTRNLSKHLPKLELLCGTEAWTFLRSNECISEWLTLFDECPWATEYQSPAFVCTWYETFEPRYEPIIVRETSGGESLGGLLHLAREKDKKRIVVAGGPQAEYHGWLSTDGGSDAFIQRAITLVLQEFECNLHFSNVLSGVPVWDLMKDTLTFNQISVSCDSRPLLDTRERSSIESVLRKKGNKSKLNRLKKLGRYSFRRLTTIEEFEEHFDEIARIFDERQQIRNGVTIFHNPLHRRFPLEYMKRYPDNSRVYLMQIDNRVVGALIGHRCGDALVVDIIAFDIQYQKYSPAKFVIYLAALDMCEQDFSYLDLTPGDAWKTAYQTRGEIVFCLDVYRNERAALKAQSISLAKAATKFAINKLPIRRS